jgi:hypothetical protein
MNQDPKAKVPARNGCPVIKKRAASPMVIQTRRGVLRTRDD